MEISAISSTQKSTITPKELLERFKKGERPEYEAVDSDDILKELDALAQKYKQSVSVAGKIDLINKEREILYEELLNPELTLSRNYNKIVKMMPKEFSPQEIEDTLRLFNLSGIIRADFLKGVYKPTFSKDKIETLKKAYLLFNETTDAGFRGRWFIIEYLGHAEKINTKLIPFIQERYKELLKSTKDKGLIENLNSKNSDFKTSSALKQLEENPNDDILFRRIIIKSSPKNKEVKEYISKVLKSENADPYILMSAIWGGGKFRSDDIFEIIKNIALNIDEPDIQKREIALHSTALYIKDKPEEVKQVLEKVSREKSEFSPLGKILFDKVTGNYYNQKDRELNYAGMRTSEADRFKKLLNRYYQTETPLTTRQENACQLNTLPFKKQLEKLLRLGKRFFIQDDTYTKNELNHVAKRLFNNKVGIYYAGEYVDTIEGVSHKKFNSMLSYHLRTNYENVAAHENGHTINELFDKKDMKTLTKLYEKAIAEHRTLNDYAASNTSEYFAVGCEAFASIYKPHASIFTEECRNAITIYQLMDKDPDLLAFIKKVLRKYH